MFDVFYVGTKPGLFPHERSCESIPHAQQLSRTRYFWIVTYLADYTGWDWLWEPPPWQAHQRHAWASQWQKDSGTYLVPKQGFADTNYHASPLVTRFPNVSAWKIPSNIEIDTFDFSWHPDPTEPEYQYHFGTQWQAAGGPIYPGAEGVKIVDWPRATALPSQANWMIPDSVDHSSWDRSWHPDPFDPPYRYEFATEWHAEGGPVYHASDATVTKYVSNPRAQLLPTTQNWHDVIEVDWFDRSWAPHPKDPPYIYVFGNHWWSAEIMPTVEYHAPGATEKKYMHWPLAQLPQRPGDLWNVLHTCEWDYSWVPDPGDPPYIYVFGNQHWPAEIMPTVEYHVPGATERKYMPGPVARLPVDMTHWHVPTGVDVSDMDFSWVPDPGEPAYIYQFATQHQKTGGPEYHVPGADETKYMDMMRAQVLSEAVPIFEIDHMDGNAGQIPSTVKKVRYFDNYRDTLIRLARNLEGQYEHVWVCSSICDYTDFDFSWHPETWQSTMLHVFASDDQKFGDTFYMHVPTFADRAEQKALLEWTSVNYVPGRFVPRRPLPVIVHDQDDHIDMIKNHQGSEPLTIFATRDPGNKPWPTVSLWREEVKTVVPLDAGGGIVIVPKAAVSHVRDQVYDYPHIDKSRRNWLQAPPLDVVFISNGESNAEENWKRLQDVLKDLPNRAHRLDGVDGRVQAYQSAARLSGTDWFFAVFAKLYVSGQFEWSWQPDRLQEAKHYIFHARNDVTGLTYGHQAMIAYNRRLVFENQGQGLDFTLDQPHEVVPEFSGVANYAHSPWIAWRTAFRECIKLRNSFPDVENEYRLNRWLTQGHGANGAFSVMGAQDAMEYYEQVSGDFDQLKKTYEWSWLSSYALIKRPQLFTQSKT